MKCDYLNDSHVNNYRYAFLPVDWRSSLTLDDGIVDSITLKSVASIRNALNSSALDIMYYTSPLFRTEVISGFFSLKKKDFQIIHFKSNFLDYEFAELRDKQIVQSFLRQKSGLSKKTQQGLIHSSLVGFGYHL